MVWFLSDANQAIHVQTLRVLEIQVYKEGLNIFVFFFFAFVFWNVGYFSSEGARYSKQKYAMEYFL
jgi:hypothetical protein